MELEIYNPTKENTVKQIDWNFEELKKEITEKAEMYGSLVYTDENIKEAKADRAKLNKFIKVLEDKRKDVKKMMLEPYTQFESQVKELVSIIGEANDNIASQVKAYTEKLREEKREKVKEIYDKAMSVEGAEGIAEILTFGRVFKESFLNSSTTFKSIVNEIEDLRDRVRHDLEVINADTGEYQFEMKQAYLKNLDMTEAISVKQQFEENARKKAEYEAKRKAEMEERKAREEAEAQKVVQAGKQVVVEQQPEETQQEVEATKIVEATVTEERKFAVSFKVYGTQKQLRELKVFLTSNNIEYGPIQ
ncbi:DUF1351 domain-containing protein [Eubacterium sp.]|uniref:DUF1351 domain-containing protein n=1 Tax=Eubacterium sp. TaxID=142586 RepID=UPI001DAA008E|nr:DUF1351 domain-containing protein [Eubacterium sp.]MBS5620451.1 DUF1351 domain-containing protein [Eubacterium sp.]